jgi:DnaK suppressor protein
MHLSENDLQSLKLQLLKLKAELLVAGETGQKAEEVVELDQTRVGRLSRMDAMQAQAMSLETGRRRRQQVLEIDAALERVIDGEYGDCFECGDIINPRRLAADPTATLCISCAQAREQG